MHIFIHTQSRNILMHFALRELLIYDQKRFTSIMSVFYYVIYFITQGGLKHLEALHTKINIHLFCCVLHYDIRVREQFVEPF